MTTEPTKHWDLGSCIEQLKSCKFECEAGPLEKNDAFIWLGQKSASDLASGKTEIACLEDAFRLYRKSVKDHDAAATIADIAKRSIREIMASTEKENAQ